MYFRVRFRGFSINLANFQATGTAQHVLEKVLNDPTYKYIVMEPGKLQMLNDMLGNTTCEYTVKYCVTLNEIVLIFRKFQAW